LSINNTVPQYIGGAGVNPQAYGNVLSYLDGYLTEINFVDGYPTVSGTTYNATTWAALNVATLFGETNPVTGVWQPKAYIGTYGTNGYELNFSDNSASTAATIGKDYSGNGNNWTPNNISVTAGVTYDSMLDTPTPFADGGNGRGNYPVLNPIKLFANNLTITDGNLSATNSSATVATQAVASMRLPSTGKWYWEVTNVSGSGLNCYAGMATTEAVADGSTVTNNIGGYRSNGAINNLAGTAQTSGATYTAGDVIGVAVDVDAGTVQFYKNGAAQGATPSFSFTAGTIIVPAVATDNSAGTKTFAANFGQRPFNSTPPTGFIALNTQNLPTPSISNGASYMAATTYTGTGASLAVTNTVNGISFQPDFVWTKVRNNTYSNHLEDAVRGVGQRLLSDSTVVEATGTNGKLTAFNSNGFTQDGGVEVGASAGTYVAWQWNAGGSTVTNTSGTISAQVRANATAGFSVVTYTGTGANATVGHGLGVAPKMIILKPRSIVSSWIVWHTAFAGTEYIVLESTAAKATLAAMWNSTTPTSSVFSIGTNANVSQNAATFVAYCFAAVAGYSAFGSYTGNASTDGPFVYTGFRPRFVMWKNASAVGDWQIFDTSRNLYNLTNLDLRPNLSQAETTQATTNQPLDFLSNGFKIRGSGAGGNGSGNTIIYAAFAENPFKNSLAR